MTRTGGAEPPRNPRGAPRANDRAVLTALAREAMIEGGLEPDFPPAADLEASAAGQAPAEADGVLDLRDRLWASIDNEESRDLDQLTVAEPLEGGRVRVLVAVADVDALVAKGSAIDGHAWHNTTSVYTPAVVFPMLPESLSTDATSLNESEDRLAFVVDMVFVADGTLVDSEIVRARVRNHARLDYRRVAAWLEGQAPAPAPVASIPGLVANLRVQDRVAQRLVELRHRRGALQLETSEATVVFEGDALSGLTVDRKNRARQLVEDFMIAANGATAAYLESKGFPSLRRVLRSPARWDRIAQIASDLGERLPDTPDAVALARFLAARRKASPADFPELSLKVVKLIGGGEYALELPGEDSPGHFGLAVKDYTHSTAPNRRFPDLVTQRLLKAALTATALPYTLPELADLARHCTLREDAVNKVERRMRKSAAALLFAGRLGQTFEAVVTGASRKGTWVRLLRPPTEGRLERGSQGLDVGDRVRVRLIGTDVERGFIDFERA